MECRHLEFDFANVATGIVCIQRLLIHCIR